MRFAGLLSLVVWASGCSAGGPDPVRVGASEEVASRYVLPGEFEPVDTVFVTWSASVEPAWKTFAEDIIRAASAQAHVVVIVSTDGEPGVIPTGPAVAAELERARAAVQAAGAKMDAVTFQPLKLDSNWVRDFGPEVVRGPGGARRAAQASCCLEDGRQADEAAGAALARDVLKLEVRPVELALKGGNLLSDGRGRCLTTDAMIEDNGGARANIEHVLRASYGCDRVFVLPALDGEPNAHVDMLVTITGPNRVLVGQAAPAEDPVNAKRLDEAAKILEDGGFTVERLPMPRRLTDVDPAAGFAPFLSYTNALAVNGVVLVPVFSQDRTHEAAALDAYRKAYPGREVAAVDASALIAFGGAVHCSTMTVASGGGAR